ncbi:hypothetical protein [Glutamicibacter nicotianae]|uniref:Uncharacterized protein n=1 Tax=Glutamicibacter nicotianae TaxID=37929 RepID=A0ABQ0RLN4_GLUNI|nr:hypothetical protein [Glutamicibacter nicotianae]GEC12714.1 hypothetical protein ANI01nite_19170 [Glutamicibacter nicotianae]
MTNQHPINPEALEAAAKALWEWWNPELPWDENDDRTKEQWRDEMAKVALSAYLAATLPEVNSDTELHVGTLIEDKTGRHLWNVWRTGGPAVHWMDDEGRPATPVFPARVMYRSGGTA